MSSRRAPPSAKDLIQAQLKEKSATRLVNSPYAKYNSRNQLMCVVCGCRVTSAIVWQAHVAKKSHLENLANLKQKQYLLNNPIAAAKRKPTFTAPDAPPSKKPSVPTAPEFKPKGILKGLKSYESSSSDEENSDEVKPTKIEIQQPKLEEDNKVKQEDDDTEGPDDHPKPPDDENDPSVFYLSEKDKAEAPKPAKPNTTEKLPEGFFDDPIADAKARKVEYVNKDEAEWNAFMQEVSAAESTSRQIIAEDTEEAAKRNQMLQAEEQMLLYQRVLKFDQAKPPKLEVKEEDAEQPMEEDSDSDEDSLSIINWRNKNSMI